MSDFLSSRRARLAAMLPLGPGILVVGAGEPVPLPEGSDQTYPFRSHPDYFYLTGRETPGGVLAFDPREAPPGCWKSFVPPVTEAEQIWEGRQQTPGEPMTRFAAWLHSRSHIPIAQLGASVKGVSPHPELSARVRESFIHERRQKDATEIALMRRAVDATAAGFARLPELIQPGKTERAVQVELEAEFYRAGADRTGYGTIVGSGPNAAVLHFEPSARTIQPNEFVLVDAGAEVGRYTADVTRTFVAGTASEFQRDLYVAVFEAEMRTIARCLPGAEWKSIHLSTAVDLVRSLIDMGVMRGEATSLVEQEAHTLFFPHGVGHMVGLGVRDAGGLAPGRTKDPRPSLRMLRMDLPLRPGYIVTVEPGLYFIPQLLNDPERRLRFRDAVHWSRVDSLLKLGGVRIEDNVLITHGSPELLTESIPRLRLP